MNIPEILLNSLDGDVQSLGVKISHREWLDIGYEGYSKVPDEVKAVAYQFAIKRGWTDQSLTNLMMKSYPHLSEFILNDTINDLRNLSQKFPVSDLSEDK